MRGPILGEHSSNHDGGNSGGSSTDGLSRQTYDEGYGYMQASQHRTEQNILYQPNALLGLDSSNNFPGQYQTGVTGENMGPGGTRASLSASRDTNFGPGSDSQLNGNQANRFMNGIDPSTIYRAYLQDFDDFGADVDETDMGGGNTQNEGPPRNSDDLDSCSPIGLSTSLFSTSDTVSGTISRAASSTAPRSRGRARTHAHGRARTCARSRAGHRTGQPVFSESSVTTCSICENDPHREHRPAYGGSADSQRSSLRRHMREEHSDGQNGSYQCSLDKDGSPCGELISRADNRRRHVERIHPTESMELPPRDAATRASNDITNARLDEWIPKVP